MNKLAFRSLVLVLLFVPSILIAQDDDGMLVDDPHTAVHADQEVIDSLITLLMNDDESPEKVQVYLELSSQYLIEDHTKSLNYSKEALELAFKIDDHEGILDCHMSIAHIHLAFTQNLQSALASYEDALEIAKGMDRPVVMIDIYRGMGNVYAALHNFDAAIDYMNQALEIAEDIDDPLEISSMNAYIGAMYEDNADTAQAIEHYKVVCDIEAENKYRNTSNASLITIAHYHFLTDSIPGAIHFYRIALKRFQRDLDNRWLSYTHSRLAHLYMTQGKFNKAEAHAINGLTIAQNYQLSKEIADNYKILIDIADSMGKPDLADRYRRSYEAHITDVQKDAEHLNAKLDEVTFAEGENTEVSTGGSGGSLWRIVSALIISAPFWIIVLLMGLPRGSKGA